MNSDRKRDLWIRRVKAVERQYELMAFAVQYLHNQSQTDISILPREFASRDLIRSQDHLAMTYLVQLFAVYGASLREYWRDGAKRRTQPRMSDLIKGVASTCRIEYAIVQAADDVREIRNKLIHEQPHTPIMPLAIVRGYLTRYLSHLPPEW